jgi:hypothetical protein
MRAEAVLSAGNSVASSGGHLPVADLVAAAWLYTSAESAQSSPIAF